MILFLDYFPFHKCFHEIICNSTYLRIKEDIDYWIPTTRAKTIMESSVISLALEYVQMKKYYVPAIRLTSMDVKDSLPATTEQQALMKLSFAQILQIVRYIATLLKFYVQLVSMKWDVKHLMSV